MKQLTILAAALAALVAMTLAATAVHAQCTVGDITMTKTFPVGNLSRSDSSKPAPSSHSLCPAIARSLTHP